MFLTKPEPRSRVKARLDRLRAKLWAKARADALHRDNWSCVRCRVPVSDNLPEWHPRRAHVNHKAGRRGDRLFDLANLETLCQGCHMPQGRHARRG